MKYYEQDLSVVERNAWQAGDTQRAILAAQLITASCRLADAERALEVLRAAVRSTSSRAALRDLGDALIALREALDGR